MERGDVAPVNTELIPNYADVQEGIKDQDYNSQRRRAVRRAARPRAEPARVPHRRGPRGPNSWSAIWDERTPYKGKISIYDDSIFIADAALYLKATQPDLGIENPYQLNEEQFDAAVNLLKGLAPNVGEWWARLREADPVVREQGQSWSARRGRYQVNVLKARQPAGRGRSSRRRARRAGRTPG